MDHVEWRCIKLGMNPDGVLLVVQFTVAQGWTLMGWRFCATRWQWLAGTPALTRPLRPRSVATSRAARMYAHRYWLQLLPQPPLPQVPCMDGARGARGI